MADRLGQAVLEISTDVKGVKEGLSQIEGLLEANQRKLKEHADVGVSAMGRLNVSIGKLATGFAAGQFITDAARSLQRWVSDAIEAAGVTTDLANRYRLSTDAVQRFAFAADQTGTSTESLLRASQQLSKRLAEGDDSVVGALRALGFTLQEALSMSQEERMYAVSEALAQVGDEGVQTSLAMDLFGKSGVDALSAVNAGFADLAQQAPVTHAEIVAALDDLGDSWDGFIAGQKSGFQEWLGLWSLLIAEGPMKTLEVYRQLERAIPQSIKGPAKAHVDALFGVTKQTQALSLSQKEMDDISKQLTESVKKKVDAHEKEQEAIEKARREWDQYRASFDGRKVFEEADRVVRVIRELGGVTALTTKEAARLKEPIDTAIEKYHQLGVQAPDDVFEVAMALDELIARTKSAGDWLEHLGLKFDTDIGSAPELFAETSIAARGLAGNLLQINENTMGWKAANGLIDHLKTGKERTEQWDDTLGALARSFADLAQVVGAGALGDVVQTIGEVITTLEVAHTASKTVKTGFAQLRAGGVDNLAAGVANLTTGFLSAIAVMERAARTGDTATSIMTSAAAGAQLGAAFGGVGAIVGLGAGAIYGWVRAAQEQSNRTEALMRQIPQLVDEINKLVPAYGNVTRAAQALGLAAQFEEAFFGRDAVGRWMTTEQHVQALAQFIADFKVKLAEANDEFKPLIQQAAEIGLVLPESLSQSIDALIEMGVIVGDNIDLFRQFTDRGEVDWRKMQAVAEEFGIEIDALGPKFEGARLGDEARRIITAFDMLKASGANVGGVLVGMKDEVLKFVGAAIEAGVKIPENFKPIIDSLLQSNQLTVDEREALDGLDDADFGPAIVSQFDLLLAKIEELIDALMNNLPGAAAKGAQEIASQFSHLEFDIPINFTVGDVQMPDFPSAIPMAEGGFGRVTRPTLFLAGEAGPEDVAFSGANRAFGRTEGDYDTMAAVASLQSELQGLRRDLVTVIPSLVENASRHGAHTAGRRR